MKHNFLIVLCLYVFIILPGCNVSGPGGSGNIPERGIAWHYPGDKGIENHPAVIFTDDFETGSIDDLKNRYHSVNNRDGKVMSFSDDVPEGSSGKRSLQMTATSDENAGGELYRKFDGGWDTVYLRFYTKFAADHGSHHHFVALEGFKDPLPYPLGGAGQRPESRISVTIEPTNMQYGPPGIWQFYAYWPEMRSWQTPEGEPDGRPSPYWGNYFRPEKPAIAPRDEWIAVEIMLQLNSSPEKSDGEIALWINGEPLTRFAPGTPYGLWEGASFRNIPGHDDAVPFEGFRWRQDMDVKVNVLRLQHYVSDTAFGRSRAWAENNPDQLINTEQATVLFDNVVMATEYTGPIRKR
jgi:hypothetical protein